MLDEPRTDAGHTRGTPTRRFWAVAAMDGRELAGDEDPHACGDGRTQAGLQSNTPFVIYELRGDDVHLFSAVAGANLSGAVLGDANLEGAFLEEANLSGADLRGASLRRAYLRKANLTGANLAGADLRDANLTGANLTGATVENTPMDGADPTGTLMPDGSQHP